MLTLCVSPRGELYLRRVTLKFDLQRSGGLVLSGVPILRYPNFDILDVRLVRKLTFEHHGRDVVSRVSH